MNEEEAKVPHVDGQWQSIEIFLFSNGQQNTPPRKYHLQADELNFWEDTLDLLAQSHYGPQSPPIDLYTIDGQLVEGPLELKDGLAYVAVTPPDSYIDAGYQKYLIRASRSWEKRQARKKIPKCLHAELCCLCPEKEWCCDFQTCCLCPEKEDEEAPESLYGALEHPELRPAGGHFISSAPSKPAPADDYRTRSGITESTPGEHAIRPGEYGARPGEFGYSLVEASAIPDDSGARLVKYGASPSEHVLRFNENGSSLEFRARTDEYGANQGEFGTKPDENVPVVSKNGFNPVENEARPSEYVASLSENGPRRIKDGARLREYGTKQGENVAIPVEYETRPSVNRAQPGEYKARLGEYETRPSINGAKLGEYGVKPGKYETRPSINGARPSVNAAKPEYDARPSEQGARPGECKTRRSINEDKLSEYVVRPGEYETRSSVNGAIPGKYKARPVENETRSSINGVKTNEYSSKPAKYETKPDDNGTKLTEYTTPGEYKTRPTVNEVKPIEYKARPAENETRSSVNGAESGNYGARPSINGAKPDEYGAIPGEYETKPSVNGTKPDENGAKPGEYETGPIINGAMPGEHRARRSVNGAKPSEYEVKPGKYETRPSINGARPSVNAAKPEYDARPSEQGARPGECKIRRSNNEDKLSEYVVRPGEYETRSSVNGAMPGKYKARPVENETRSSINGVKTNEYSSKPAKYETKPDDNGAKLTEYEATPGEYKTRPTVNEVKPIEYKARPAENETRSSVNGAESGNYGARPSINGAKPSEYGARSGEFADKRTRPDEYGPKPAKDRASDEDQVRPTVYEAVPGNDGPYLNEIESKKEAHEIGLRDNEISLDDNLDRPNKDTADKDAEPSESELEKKGEYKVTGSDQRNKQIDPKSRASGNRGIGGGARRVSDGEQSSREYNTVNRMSEPRSIEIENAHRPSELKPSGIEHKRRPSQQRGQIEHTTRLSRQAGAEKELGGKPGELNREFEHGGRASEQKGKEINPVGRTGVNAARLSEQRNKQSDHLARLGGESRVGDHEDRAGDLGFRTSNTDAGLVNPGSKVPDTGTRTAVSGSRASPRDRTSSIAKTNNLGQPKLGTPCTRVDETAAKLGESKIKNRMGYPGARQSNVGGTGAASHIFEAQQHPRRTSLSAGRASIEKKRLSIGQNSSFLKKPAPISSVLRKSEEKQPIKTNKEILQQKMTGKASTIPVTASNDVGQSKTMPKDPYKPITPPALPPPSSITDLVNLGTNKAPLEIIIDENEIIAASTYSFREPESEIRSMRFDSVKQVVDVIMNFPQETQTERIYAEKSMVSFTVNEGVQTNREPVEQENKNQENQGQEVSASNKAKVNSCTCTCALCCKRDHRLATVDPNENIISIQNKGDVINIKVNIDVRNIVRSNPCQKNVTKSRSLTNFARSEKQSQISIDDRMILKCKSSLLSISNHQQFRGNGFEGSPKVMVVQCAGCGRLNYPPRCDQPPCCDNNKQYFILLANSVNEDMNDCDNFNPLCQPCNLRQSPLRKPCSSVPLKQTLSEMTLDTITTVTVSGVPLQRRELVQTTGTTCQTEEPRVECMTKRKVSISEDWGTRCDYQKESCSSISATTQVDNVKTNHSCRKICPQMCEHEDSQVYLEFCPPVPSCQKLQSICSQVRSEACPQVQPQGCMPVSPKCTQCCPKPLPCIQVQTQVCPQVPQVSDAQTQTQWSSIVLQARLHPDGRYSFHLPPLNVLNIYPF